MKDGNNFRVKSRIKFTPPTESARQEFQSCTACFAKSDSARPALLARFRNQASDSAQEQADISAPQEHDTPLRNFRDTHTLVIEEYYDGHTTHKRDVYIPKEDNAPATPIAAMAPSCK